MKAILVKEDRRLVWSDIPTPKVLPEQVLIRVEYAAVRYVWRKVSCGESVRRSSAFSRSRRRKRRTCSCMTARAPEKSYCTSPDNGAENEKTSDKNRTFFTGARRR